MQIIKTSTTKISVDFISLMNSCCKILAKQESTLCFFLKNKLNLRNYYWIKNHFNNSNIYFK